MSKISNVELILLEVIEEIPEISGYEINQLVEKRGYRDWAGIGLTSIYTGLKKLKNKELVFAYLETKKEGKGPFPNKYSLTVKGRSLLKEEIKRSLAESQERDKTFDLGLAGIPFISHEEVTDSLKTRIDSLFKRKQMILSKYRDKGGDTLPHHVRRLFDRSKALIDNDIQFTQNLLTRCQKEKTPGEK